MKAALSDIIIRTNLEPGDLGYVVHLHGSFYGKEYGYGIQFEAYVARGIHDFYQQYDPARDRVWICEHGGRIIGTLLLMHRGEDSAQLRYFMVLPEYQGIGLGKRLMELFIEFFGQCGYRSAYLWTVDGLPAAAALYRRHGFRLTEEKPSTAFGKPLREQRYELVLEHPPGSPVRTA